MLLDSERVSFGAYLRQSRQNAKITQKKLSIRLGYSSPQFVSNWERNMSFPSPEKIAAIASVLGIRAADIVEALIEEKTLKLRRKLDEEVHKAISNSEDEGTFRSR